MKNLFFISILALGMHLYYTDYSGKILKYWVEPKELNYYNKQQRDYRYRLSVVETTRKMGFFNINQRHYEIFISKQSVKPELDVMYGHYKEYGLEGDKEELERVLSQSHVEWKEDGVWFVEPDGHRLFFPKSSFMGGR